MKKRIFCLLAVLMVLFCLLGHADFGDFSGGSDYGGSDYSSSDWSYSSSSDWDSSSGDGEWSIETIVVMGSIFIVCYVLCNREKKTKPKGAKGVDTSTLKPVSALTDFNEREFTGKLSNMYIRLQEAWAAGDLTPVEPLLSAPYFAQMDNQLQRDFVSKGITSHLEYISVLDVKLLGCKPGEGDEPDRLYASLKTRFVNYLTDKNGKIVRGSRKDEIYMEYEWALERSADHSAERVTNCPNCGSPIDANRSAICPYCGSVIESSGYDWVLTQIKGISRKTVKH